VGKFVLTTQRVVNVADGNTTTPGVVAMHLSDQLTFGFEPTGH
jgi:hypothetical protein